MPPDRTDGPLRDITLTEYLLLTLIQQMANSEAEERGRLRDCAEKMYSHYRIARHQPTETEGD